MNNAVTPLFKAVELSGKTYESFTDGRSSKFLERAIVSD